jgi:hypothetical protein
VGRPAVAGLIAATLCISVLVAAPAQAAPPVVTIGSASAASYTSAHVTGEVDPQGEFTEYLFEASSDGGVNWGGTNLAGTVEGSGPQTVEGTLQNLSPGASYQVRLTAFNLSEFNFITSPPPNPEFKTLAVSAPVVTIAPPTALEGTSAHFTGSVEAGGSDLAFNADCTFDYVDNAGFQAEGFANAQAIGCQPPSVEGASVVPVHADPTNLQPNTTYHVRIRATNLGGTSTEEAPVFAEPKILPTAVESFASEVGLTKATLNARLRAGGDTTTYHFEFLPLSQYLSNGETFAGAQRTPESPLIGADNAPLAVSFEVAGISAATAYRFRVVATNRVGSTSGEATAFVTNGPQALQNCANERLREENNSLAVPDCRAYELVSPDLGHAALHPGNYPFGLGTSASDGNVLLYGTGADSPEHSEYGALAINYAHAVRDPITGWHGVSLTPRLNAPISAYLAYIVWSIAPDLSSLVFASDEPFVPGAPPGLNVYVREPDKTFRLLTRVGQSYAGGIVTIYPQAPEFTGISEDSSHWYFLSYVRQFPTEPENSLHYMVWSADRGLRTFGVLPGEVQATSPTPLAHTVLPAMSADGKFVLFSNEEKLYLRINDERTVQVDQSQAQVPDPNPRQPSIPLGVTRNGATVLFTSYSELTDDANTGESGGVPTDAGANLYSFDTRTGELTDLTVATKPEDAAAGAAIQFIPLAFDGAPIAEANPEGNYLYFVAKGNLAPGGVSGRESLYVWHEGSIEFIAPAAGLVASRESLPFHMSSDGSHVAFATTESLTGYNNSDAKTGAPDAEIFVWSRHTGLECASCRPDGSRPTAESSLPSTGAADPSRVLSDDGARVFFTSADAIVPSAAGGQTKVFEYANHKPSLISPPQASAGYLDASASGDDVFFESFAAPVPNPNAGDPEVYDARVRGGFQVPELTPCGSGYCRPAAAGAPDFSTPVTSAVSGSSLKSARCPKGKIKHGSRCVKKKKAENKKGGHKKTRHKHAKQKKRAFAKQGGER